MCTLEADALVATRDVDALMGGGWCLVSLIVVLSGCNSESSREASERGLVSLSIAVAAVAAVAAAAAAAVAAAVLQISATPLWMTSCATHRQIVRD